MRQTVAVIGLGVFGRELCHALVDVGAEVVAIDRLEENVRPLVELVARTVIGDSTDPEVLAEAGLADVDVAVVAIGDDIESSVITALNLQELAIGPIHARATSEIHRRVLRKIGVAEVMRIEEVSAQRLARVVTRSDLEQLAALDDEFEIVEIGCPTAMQDRDLAALKLRNRLGVLVVGVRRVTETIDEEGGVRTSMRFVLPTATTRLHGEDRLILIGRRDDIARLTR